jgi:hypothetical protein
MAKQVGPISLSSAQNMRPALVEGSVEASAPPRRAREAALLRRSRRRTFATTALKVEARKNTDH